MILACSATKRGDQKYLPAIERYDRPLWRTLRKADPYGEKTKVAFLSARLGFGAADTPIELYDTRMSATAFLSAGGADSLTMGALLAFMGRDREGWWKPRLLEERRSSDWHRASGGSKPSCNALQSERLWHCESEERDAL